MLKAIMDINTLKIKLEEAEINPIFYSLDGRKKEDTIIIEKRINSWCVFYFERGKIWQEKLFETEEQACTYFYNCLTQTPYFK